METVPAPPTRVSFRLLGPLQVVAESGPIEVRGQKQRALLALLLLDAGRVVSSDRLIEELWAGAPPATAASSLRNLVTQLRRLLGAEVVVGKPPGYLLAVEGEQLDVVRFERLVAKARIADLAERVMLLREALELWRGPPLANLAYEPFAQPEIGRLEELRLSALEQRLEAQLELGQGAELVPELERLVADHPLRERLRAQLMLALYRAGRQADALDSYHAMRHRLGEELGLEPGSSLQALYTSILRQDPGLAPPSTSRPLPSELTPLVGRAHEIDELVKLLRRGDVHLVSVTGPGGCGKTRVALRAARELAGDYETVGWAGLAPLTDPELVLAAAETALGEMRDLAASVGARKVLLVLDNFEHLVDAAPDVGRLLGACPNMDVLVTSRERLKIAGEHEYALLPLPRPDAIALFDQCARALQPGFVADAAVERLCEQLDDLPLAIELAAARVKLLSPAELVERLRTGFDLLRGGRDADPAHATLRATIEWSYNLLTEHEQRLIAQFSVFRGGCTLEAAEAVCGADVEALGGLVDKSLVRCVDGRFSMLATVRTYMEERLTESGSADAISRALAEHLLALLQQVPPSPVGTDIPPALRARVLPELDNVRAVVDWALAAAEVELAVRLATASVPFRLGIAREQLQWLRDGLAKENSLATRLRAEALRAAGACAWVVRELREADALLQESLDLFLELGDNLASAATLHLIGVAAEAQEDTPRARASFERSLELSRRIGDDKLVSLALHDLGELELTTGNVAAAENLLRQSRERALAARDEWAMPGILHGLGDVALVRLDLEAAARQYLDALRTELRPARPRVVAHCLGGIAAVAAATDPERAGTLWGAIRTLEQHPEARIAPHSRRIYEERIEDCRSRQPDALNAAMADGASLTAEQAIEYALAVRD